MCSFVCVCSLITVSVCACDVYCEHVWQRGTVVTHKVHTPAPALHVRTLHATTPAAPGRRDSQMEQRCVPWGGRRATWRARPSAHAASQTGWLETRPPLRSVLLSRQIHMHMCMCISRPFAQTLANWLLIFARPCSIASSCSLLNSMCRFPDESLAAGNWWPPVWSSCRPTSTVGAVPLVLGFRYT